MGRGSDYRGSHPHFMLFDDDVFTVQLGYYTVDVEFDSEPSPSVVFNLAEKGVKPEINGNAWSIEIDEPDEDAEEKAKDLKKYFEGLDCVSRVTLTEPSTEPDEDAFKSFKQEVATAFNAYEYKDKYTGRESYSFADTDLLTIGINRSGGCPCLWVEPKTYDNGDEEVKYRIDRSVQIAFNKLIADYGNMFRFPTSAWTSEPLTTYSRTD